MKGLWIAWHSVVVVLVTLLSVWWVHRLLASANNAAYPSRPVQVVVPFKAGGGSDTFVRIVARGIEQGELLGQPFVVINQDGGVGTIGSRDVKQAPPDGYRIMCHHNAIITAKLTQTVPYGPEAFAPIALTGETSLLVLVRDDSPYGTIVELLQQAKRTPNRLRFGANKGAPPYFATLQLEQSVPGAKFNIVSAGGGADRYSKIIGGHLEAGIFSLAEYLDFLRSEETPPSENIRAIAVLDQRRHESIPNVPTATELGIPVVLNNANYWLAPKGTPKPILQQLASVLELAMQNPDVRKELARLRIEPTFESGPSFASRLNATVRQFESVVATRATQALPRFEWYVIGLVALLWVGVVVERWRRGGTEAPIDSGDCEKPRFRLAVACFLALCIYVGMLGRASIPFACLAAAMVLAIGSMIKLGGGGRWLVLVELALLTGLGTEFLFTEIFATPLP